jgi:hypothetical protein
MKGRGSHIVFVKKIESLMFSLPRMYGKHLPCFVNLPKNEGEGVDLGFARR